MAKNLSRKFATMSEDERRKFAMKNEGGTDSAPEDLDLENPRGTEAEEPAGNDSEARHAPEN
jgi:hypothetical protein